VCVMQQCEKQLDVFNITLMRRQAEIAVLICCIIIIHHLCFETTCSAKYVAVCDLK